MKGSFGDVRDVLAALPHRLYPGDYSTLPLLFPVRHRLIRELDPQPRSVFEFGALLGYFLVVALDAAPSIVRVGWVDNESMHDRSNHLTATNLHVYCGSVGRKVEATCGHHRDWAWTLAAGGSRFDLVSVDGDHSFAGCLDDLEAAAALRPRTILVDDWTADSHAADIQRAVGVFRAAHQGWSLEEHVTENGLAVLRKENG